MCVEKNDVNGDAVPPALFKVVYCVVITNDIGTLCVCVCLLARPKVGVLLLLQLRNLCVLRTHRFPPLKKMLRCCVAVEGITSLYVPQLKEFPQLSI